MEGYERIGRLQSVAGAEAARLHSELGFEKVGRGALDPVGACGEAATLPGGFTLTDPMENGTCSIGDACMVCADEQSWKLFRLPVTDYPLPFISMQQPFRAL